MELKHIWFLQTRNYETEPGCVYYMFGRFYETIEEADAEAKKIEASGPNVRIRVAEEWVHPGTLALILEAQNQQATLQDVRELIQDDLMCVLDGIDQKLVTAACQIVVDRFQILTGKYKR